MQGDKMPPDSNGCCCAGGQQEGAGEGAEGDLRGLHHGRHQGRRRGHAVFHHQGHRRQGRLRRLRRQAPPRTGARLRPFIVTSGTALLKWSHLLPTCSHQCSTGVPLLLTITIGSNCCPLSTCVHVVAPHLHNFPRACAWSLLTMSNLIYKDAATHARAMSMTGMVFRAYPFSTS